MLSRSSLETQKLELMSAMSELKLQQAALERENLDLRTNHLNNNSSSLVNGHGGSTGSIRRPPMAPTRLNSAATTQGVANGQSLGGSHGNLQQQQQIQHTANGSVATPGAPKVGLAICYQSIDSGN